MPKRCAREDEEEKSPSRNVRRSRCVEPLEGESFQRGGEAGRGQKLRAECTRCCASDDISGMETIDLADEKHG